MTRHFDSDTFRPVQSIPPQHVPSLLEELGIDPDMTNEKATELYCGAIDRYINDAPGNRTFPSWEQFKHFRDLIGKIGGPKELPKRPRD